MTKGFWAWCLIFSLFAFGNNLLSAQAIDHVQGEILISLKENADKKQLVRDLAFFRSQSTSFRLRKQIQAPLNIWIGEFDFTRIHEGQLLDQLRDHPMVLAAQFNHFLDLRSTLPNDPQFERQWQYLNLGGDGGLLNADFDIDLAWDLSTGGVTSAGDTIVVCIIDNGFDIQHEDFGGNIWVNYAEVPDNGFDDDGNGFTDDYLGWNTVGQNDNIDVENENHGTPVAGIIGARGNNDLGVSGVNWAVKLMIVAGGTGLESEAIQAFSYPLAQRRLYNESNGQKGAFVVATNASWGRNSAQPKDFPLWCAIYDILGAEGIINIAATANADIDVEEEGDMPTGCQSNFLIGVTNIDRNDQKPRLAAFGQSSVDLGAYGEDIWTVKNGNSYGTFKGTSAATPHVAGAVALLYATSCTKLAYLAQFDPPTAALLTKEYILNSTQPITALEGITLSGGRLNIHDAMQLALSDCGTCPLPAGLEASEITEETARLTWRTSEEIDKIDLRWRPLGNNDWMTIKNTLPPFKLEGLNACTEYEFQIQVNCGTTMLDFSPSLVFRTEGCCERPERFRLAVSNDKNAVLQWDSVPTATQYTIRLLQVGSTLDKVMNIKGNIAFLNGLTPCTEYQMEIRTVCEDGMTDFGELFVFTTLGCGACIDLSYCQPSNADASEEWISEIALNTLEFYSGSDGGYGDFTGLPSTQLIAGKAYPISISPGFAANPLFEYFQVWIDLNQDGIFSNREIVFDPGGVSRQTVTGSLNIPADAEKGKTRLRVMMKFRDPAGPCGFIDRPFGEYEDYCISIVDEENECGIPLSFDTLSTGPFRAEFRWKDEGESDNYLLRYRIKGELAWELLNLDKPRVALEQLEACTEYEAQVKSICGEFYGRFTDPFSFQTACSTPNPRIVSGIDALEVFPNPFRENLNLNFRLKSPQENIQIRLFNTAGQKVLEQLLNLPEGDQTIRLKSPPLPSGVYWLSINPKQGQGQSIKVVKVQ